MSVQHSGPSHNVGKNSISIRQLETHHILHSIFLGVCKVLCHLHRAQLLDIPHFELVIDCDPEYMHKSIFIMYDLKIKPPN